MNFSVLIVDKMHASVFKLLEEIHLHFDYLPDIQRKDILNIIDKYDGIIIRSKTPIDSEFLNKASKLKFIGRAGSGMDMLDLDIIHQRNITVMNAPEGNRDSVAEHTMGMLLALLIRLPQSDSQVKNYIWNREANRGFELKNKTFSIIGYGNVGKELAKRLKGFDCEILAYDKYITGFENDFVKEADMDEVFTQSDIVSFHIPLSDETRKMIDEDYINKFKKNIILINTARGELVDLGTLRKAIERGKLLGACLDVLENDTPSHLNKKKILISLSHPGRSCLAHMLQGGLMSLMKGSIRS